MNNIYIFQLVILIFSLSSGPPAWADPDRDADSRLAVAEDTESVLENIEDTGDETEQATTEDAEVKSTISRYAEKVLQLEAENGAYNRDLVEELVGLGQAYSNIGDYQEARDVFTRALHIIRVNDGLHTLNQLPILEQIIKVNTELNNYEELNDNYNYLLWVNDRNYKPDDLHRVDVYIRAANWHMDAYDMTPPPESVQHLIMAANFYSKAAEVIEKVKGADAPDLINPLYGIVNANFKLVEPYGFIPDIDAFISGKLNPLLPSNFSSDFDMQEQEYPRNNYRALDYSQEHLSRIVQDEKYTFSLVQNSYKSGRNALLRIIDIHEKNPDLPALSYAYALTHMGDWYLRFYKRRYALAYYDQAYQILRSSDYGEEAIKTLFGRPHPLGNFEYQPEFDFEKYRVVSSVDVTDDPEDTPARISEEDLKDSKYVLVRFRVTRYGAVRNLEILASNPPDNVRFRRMARSTINSTPFRPRLENGQPIRTENVKMLYRFQ